MTEYTDGQIVAAEMDGEWHIGLWRGMEVLDGGEIAARIQTGTNAFIHSSRVRNVLTAFPDASGIPKAEEQHGLFRVGQRVSAWSSGAGRVYTGVVAKADPVAWCYHVIRDNGGGEYYTERDLSIAVQQAAAIEESSDDAG